MSEADDILALGPGGEVIEQGSLTQLQNAGGYIQSLDHTPQTGGTKTRSTSSPADTEPKKSPTIPVNEVEEPTRASDSAVWKYYATSLGWARLGLWGIFLAAHILIWALLCTPGHSQLLTDYLC